MADESAGGTGAPVFAASARRTRRQAGRKVIASATAVVVLGVLATLEAQDLSLSAKVRSLEASSSTEALTERVAGIESHMQHVLTRVDRNGSAALHSAASIRQLQSQVSGLTQALQATAATVAALSSASNSNTLDDLDFRVSQLEACIGDIQQTLEFPDPSGFGVVILPNCPAGF